MAASDTSTAAPAAEAAPAKPVKAGKKGDTITVVGPPRGSYRAGQFFGPTATVVDLSTISAEQLAAIKADPRLHVS